MDIEYLPVTMIRSDMKDLPSVAPPEGFKFRNWHRDDMDTLTNLWKASEPFLTITRATFETEFGHDLSGMFRRCFFLLSPDGREIGTATAWYDREFQEKPWGRVHWVALLPEYRGKGLGNVIVSECMKRLRGLGHRRSMLQTQTPRLAAIKSYMKFGFEPYMQAEHAERAWPLIYQALGMQ